MSVRTDMEALLDEERDLEEAYKSPSAAMDKFNKALMKGTPHSELAKLLYDALMAAHDSMTSKGGLRGKLGAPLKRAAGELLKMRSQLEDVDLEEAAGEYFVYRAGKRDSAMQDSDGVMAAKGLSKDERLFVFASERPKSAKKLVWKGRAKAQMGQTASGMALRMASKKLNEAKKPSKRAVEKTYDKLFRKMGDGVQFNIMDLGKMHKEVVAAMMAGDDPAEAMEAAMKKYRKN